LEEVSTTRGSGWVRSQARQMLHPLSLNFSILDQQDDLTFHVRTDQFVLYASSAKNQCIPGRTAPASRKTEYLTWKGVSHGPNAAHPPAAADGTDCIQARFRNFEAKPHPLSDVGKNGVEPSIARLITNPGMIATMTSTPLPYSESACSRDVP
jgi:hypothetical protein